MDVKPAGADVHAYELPEMSAAPIDAEKPAQMADAVPASATGTGFTVTTTELGVEHPVAEMVSTSVYVVVIVGETEGLAADDVKPAGEEVQL